MKIGKVLLLAFLLVCAGRTNADNLMVESDTLNAGSTMQIGVCLHNPEHKYVAFQFDLSLPEGVTIATNDKGRLSASLNPERFQSHTLSVSDIGSNRYRFLAYSLNNVVVSGTTGPIVNIIVKIADDITPGTKAGELMSQTFIFPDGKEITWDDAPFTIEVKHDPNAKEKRANTETFAKEKVKPVGKKDDMISKGKVYASDSVVPE